jgi:hypothetical protein
MKELHYPSELCLKRKHYASEHATRKIHGGLNQSTAFQARDLALRVGVAFPGKLNRIDAGPINLLPNVTAFVEFELSLIKLNAQRNWMRRSRRSPKKAEVGTDRWIRLVTW